MVVTISRKLLGLYRHIPSEYHIACRPDVIHSASPNGAIQPITTDKQHPLSHAYILQRIPPAFRGSL